MKRKDIRPGQPNGIFRVPSDMFIYAFVVRSLCIIRPEPRLYVRKPANMRVVEVVIDGFKSYAVRTVISGWDEAFNSITGLNGSGKSNILDAICFVLGITSMSTVRAQNIQVSQKLEPFHYFF